MFFVTNLPVSRFVTFVLAIESLRVNKNNGDGSDLINNHFSQSKPGGALTLNDLGERTTVSDAITI